MRKTIGAAVLLLALTLSARAGEIPTPAGPEESGPTSAQSADGEIPYGLTETVSSVLESLLALF
jgi:hypothetical protein